MGVHLERLIYFGEAPVPYTARWDSELPYRVARCRYARMAAVCQPSSPEVGKPVYGEQHFDRQREVVTGGLCDLCALSLEKATKVSLSDAHPRKGAAGWAVCQFEPLLHRDCAVISMRHCPWLRGRVRSGEVAVRQVTRWRAQLSILEPAAVAENIPGYTGPDVAGYALVELLQWIDRDADWLGSIKAAA